MTKMNDICRRPTFGRTAMAVLVLLPMLLAPAGGKNGGKAALVGLLSGTISISVLENDEWVKTHLDPSLVASAYASSRSEDFLADRVVRRRMTIAALYAPGKFRVEVARRVLWDEETMDQQVAVDLLRDINAFELKPDIGSDAVRFRVMEEAIMGGNGNVPDVAEMPVNIILVMYDLHRVAAVAALYQRPQDSDDKTRMNTLSHHLLMQLIESRRAELSWPPGAKAGWLVRDALTKLADSDEPAFRAYAAAVMDANLAFIDEEILGQLSEDRVAFVARLATKILEDHRRLERRVGGEI